MVTDVNVDDFVILHPSSEILENYKDGIARFLVEKLKLELHPDKSRIIAVDRGVSLLGFRVFNHNKLLKKSSVKKLTRKLSALKVEFDRGKTSYDRIHSSLEGWLAYARQGNTCGLRRRIIKKFEAAFINEIAAVEICRWLKAAANRKA